MTSGHRFFWLSALFGSLALIFASCGRGATEPLPGAGSELSTANTIDQAESTIDLRVLPGFDAVLFASGLHHPTSMAMGPDGNLYVGQQNGKILSVSDSDGDGVGDTQTVYATGLGLTLGIAFVGEDLYVSHRRKVTRLADTDGDGVSDVQTDIITDLPVGGEDHQHVQNNGITLGADGFLYVSIGIDIETGEEQESSSDRGQPQAGSDSASDHSQREEGRLGLGVTVVGLGVPDARSGTITRFRPDGSEQEIYATGFKNPLGITFDSDGNLFATDNAPHNPDGPDELNLVLQGANYGYPNRPGGQNNAGTVPVVAELEVASTNGMAFYYGDQFPEEYRGDVFIAQWGSQRGQPASSNKVVRVILERTDDRFTGTASTFAVGFEHPLTTLVGPDGSLFVADWGSLNPEDPYQGAIYRIFYEP